MTHPISARALLNAGAALTAMIAAPAVAQTAPDATPEAQTEDAPANGDIVVTARRRAETLLNVPIAVTAFSAARL